MVGTDSTEGGEMPDLSGMKFLITGGAKGIGRTTGMVAANKYGAKVVLSDIADEEGEAAAAEIQAAGGDAVYIHCDVTDERQIGELIPAAAEAFGGLDVLHNNAGVHESQLDPTQLTLETMSIELFDQMTAINLRGPWIASKYAVPYLKESDYPSIINAGSVGSMLAYPNCVAYAPTKHGIAGLTKALAVDLAQYKIRVNGYCPASINTGMVDMYLAAAEDREAMLKGMTATHLVRRLGEPEDVAELVCFLASRDAEFIDGSMLLIDGGSLAWRATVDAIGIE
jgi:NAD(P)-dependent dehydrogenase (short-subunit alcohol dehydrogenase family)